MLNPKLGCKRSRLEAFDQDRREPFPVRRIGKGEIESSSTQTAHVFHGISTPDLHLGLCTKQLSVGSDRIQRATHALHEHGPLGSPAQRLEPESPGACEEVQHGCPFQIRTQCRHP